MIHHYSYEPKLWIEWQILNAKKGIVQAFRTALIIANRNRIHESTISLRFLGIILRVLRLEVSVYNVYITNQSQTTFAVWGGGGSKISQWR